jgi:hypothetical protein
VFPNIGMAVETYSFGSTWPGLLFSTRQGMSFGRILTSDVQSLDAYDSYQNRPHAVVAVLTRGVTNTVATPRNTSPPVNHPMDVPLVGSVVMELLWFVPRCFVYWIANHVRDARPTSAPRRGYDWMDVLIVGISRTLLLRPPPLMMTSLIKLVLFSQIVNHLP